MTPAPKRRWFRIGLTVIFAGLLAGGLICLLGWHRSAMPEAPTLIGSISPSDIEAIRKVIVSEPSIRNKLILTLEVIRPGKVNAQMGESQPGSKWGQSVGLEKIDGSWKILVVSEWNA